MIKAILFDYLGVIRKGHTLDQQVINQAKQLSKSFIVALASNLPDQYLTAVLEETTLNTIFNPIFTSSSTGTTKPNSYFYTYILHEFGLLPEECLLIDDSPGNIAGAVAVGMHGIVYENAVKLELDLKSYL